LIGIDLKCGARYMDCSSKRRYEAAMSKPHRQQKQWDLNTNLGFKQPETVFCPFIFESTTFQ
jgi:hypothetical protein